MKKLGKVAILAVVSFAMFTSEAFSAGKTGKVKPPKGQAPVKVVNGKKVVNGTEVYTGGKTSNKSGKTESGKATGGKTMEDTFGPSKPLVPSSPAKTAVKTVIWDGQKVTIRSGQVFDGFVPELSYGTIDGCSNTYMITRFGVFSESEKDAYCETFKQIVECMVQAKNSRAKSFTKEIPCSVKGSSFVFEWTSNPIGPPPAGKTALELQETINSCKVVFTKTDLVTKAVVSTDTYNKPEIFVEFFKMLKSQDIVSEFNKRNGTPSDAEKNSK